MTLSVANPALRERREVRVRGIVQGVGFRPFVYSLAVRCGLGGWVRNDAAGVEVQVEGTRADLDAFLAALREESPPLAVVEAVSWLPMAPVQERAFRILESRDGPQHRALVSPDVATCADCLRELFDPADRRYRYPFINCTHCGPRFTLIRGVPYDRPLTTMDRFPMCAECLREYHDPADRRFHAQPNACPDCGPRVRLVDAAGREISPDPDPIEAAARLLRQGALLAVKGLGGYHLASDPFNADAVRALRRRKTRQDKPFALMARDLEEVRSLAHVSPAEAAALEDPARPIVLLERRHAVVDPEVAPRQSTLGVMLAYTPLHHLLLETYGGPLVMTSGNRCDEPIAYQDEDAFTQLGGIADAFLVHDRPIHMRCDDSVARVDGGSVTFLRRSRGYAPRPLDIAEPFRRPVLACGGELKATFCLGRDRHAFLSHHIGDLSNEETLTSYRQAVEHYCRLFDVRPELLACDLHPGYLSTQFAEESETEVPLVRIQHHHAHLASCLADNRRPVEERVIGIAFDGTGLGLDGAIWGGEFFTGTVRDGFTRRAHLAYVPLPGGEAAIRHPWRMALAHLAAAFGAEEAPRLVARLLPAAEDREARVVARMLERRVNCPLTSSAGRLFDAVAALLGLPGTDRTTYEGQAAVELELAAGGRLANSCYPMPLRRSHEPWVLETADLVAAIVQDLRAGRPRGEIAARFHASVAAAAVECCCRLREEGGPDAVALSGGTFQNRLLLRSLTARLEASGFAVYRHRRVPSNDGGLALGQAVLAEPLFGSGEGR